MIEWRDQGLLLSVEPHGEGHAVAQVLTEAHGRHAGLVHGGASSRRAHELQPGAALSLSWRARLPDHLGTYTYELETPHAAFWLEDRRRLAGIASACAVATALPEREPMPGVYHGLCALLAALESEAWPAAYVMWELGVLSALGYGLALDRCVRTGATEGLAYVSPRTGAAVTAEAAGELAPKLLRLPGFLAGEGEFDDAAIAAGLKLTAHFLKRDAFGITHRDLPPARYRLADCFPAESALSAESDPEDSV
jgi:DNA repair protein RecO (recombination protein O)